MLLISDLPFDLAQAPRLRWVQTASAGVDHLAGHSIMQSQVHLTSASGIHAVPIGEHVLTMMLAWSRQPFATARWRDGRTWRGPGEEYRAVELQMGNVILTPHVAGNSVRYGERLARLFADNLARYMRGEPLLNLIDKRRGY